MRYVPENPPLSIDRNLSEWLFRELLRIGNVLTITEEKDAAQDAQNAAQDALLALLTYQDPTAYTPTVDASTGTFTSITGISGKSIKIGKFVLARGQATITTVGSASGFIQFSLPFTVGPEKFYGSGRQDIIGGVALQVVANASDTKIQIEKYDHTSAIAATAVISWTIPYWTA